MLEKLQKTKHKVLKNYNLYQCKKKLKGYHLLGSLFLSLPKKSNEVFIYPSTNRCKSESKKCA